MSRRLPPGVSVFDLPGYDNPRQEEIERRAEQIMEEKNIEFDEACEIAAKKLECEGRY